MHTAPCTQRLIPTQPQITKKRLELLLGVFNRMRFFFERMGRLPMYTFFNVAQTYRKGHFIYIN